MPTGFSSGAFTKIADGLYRVSLGKGFATGRASTGLEKLVFEIVYFLMTTRGSIPSDPDIGTSLREFVGTLSIGRDGVDQAAVLIADEISRSAEIIRSRQSQVTITNEETLDTIFVDEVVVDRASQSATVRIVVNNRAGQAAGFEIPLT